MMKNNIANKNIPETGLSARRKFRRDFFTGGTK